MAVRANQIGAGGAGVGERLLDALLGALRADVTPFARELGSLGTGDLTVLAEIGAALGGEGDCWVGDDVVPAAEALAAAGLDAGTLRPARRPRVHELERGHRSARPRSCSTTPRGCSTPRSASPRCPTTRPTPTSPCSTRACTPRARTAGQVEVARRLRELLGAREPRERAGPRAVHDAFVFRCVPQVEGTLFDGARAAARRARDRAQRRGRERADAARATASRCRTATSTPAC